MTSQIINKKINLSKVSPFKKGYCHIFILEKKNVLKYALLV